MSAEKRLRAAAKLIAYDAKDESSVEAIAGRLQAQYITESWQLETLSAEDWKELAWRASWAQGGLHAGSG